VLGYFKYGAEESFLVCVNAETLNIKTKTVTKNFIGFVLND